MGGHSAWRKRVRNNELAKQGGGAICRHRPRFGKTIHLNQKKGKILGGPKKKKRRNQQHCQGQPQPDQGQRVDDDNKIEITPPTRPGIFPAAKFVMEGILLCMLFFVIRIFVLRGWKND